MGKIRVLVVDDSAVVRQTLTAILNTDPKIEVIGTASDPFFAAKKIVQCNILRSKTLKTIRKDFFLVPSLLR